MRKSWIALALGLGILFSGACGAFGQESGNFFARATGDLQVRAGAGFVHSISIAPLTATPTAGLLTIYDSLTEANTVIYSEWVFATTPGHTITLNVPFNTGLYVGYDAALANVTVTVSYR